MPMAENTDYNNPSVNPNSVPVEISPISAKYVVIVQPNDSERLTITFAVAEYLPFLAHHPLTVPTNTIDSHDN